ncbi:MAG: SDR family NAD(P)-dependent oxidoreductase [Flavobacteriaceae bacterium]
MNVYDLRGRNAVVTGGSSGIGYAVAERFLKSGAGVEIWGRDKEKLETAREALSAHGNVTSASVDVSKWEQVKAGAQGAIGRHGHIDILFNCAGMVLEVKPMLELSVEVWEETIAINLNSIFFCCRAFAPAMVERGYGRIINTGSMTGKDGNVHHSAYVAAKAGVMGMTKSFGKELATSGVLVNCVIPTVFETPLVKLAMSKSPETIQASINTIPMRRMGRPEEAAAMVTWLASEECSFSTGFSFDLSGGKATY